MGLRLVVVDGPWKGRQLRLKRKPLFELGSSSAADLQLAGSDVALVHVKLYREGDGFECLDVSGDGFLHDGKPTTRARLVVGSSFRIGQHHIRLISDGPVPTQTPLETGGLGGNGKPALVAVQGNDVGRRYPLGEKAQILGRGATTDITIWDIRASRAHARIDRKGTAFRIADLNSSNGTFLNEEPLDMTPRPLAVGDRIRIGSTVLQFLA